MEKPDMDRAQTQTWTQTRTQTRIWWPWSTSTFNSHMWTGSIVACVHAVHYTLLYSSIVLVSPGKRNGRISDWWPPAWNFYIIHYSLTAQDYPSIIFRWVVQAIRPSPRYSGLAKQYYYKLHTGTYWLEIVTAANCKPLLIVQGLALA